MGVTSEHPFFAEGRGWTAVGLLHVGDHIQAEQGKPLVVAAMDVVDKPVLVYNFEVGQDHSYFAGEDGAWAHNGRIRGPLRKAIFDGLKGVCPECGIGMVFKGPQIGPRRKRFSCDHITAQSNGGTDDPSNIGGLCLSCNARKWNHR